MPRSNSRGDLILSLKSPSRLAIETKKSALKKSLDPSVEGFEAIYAILRGPVLKEWTNGSFLGENKNTQLWIHPAPTPACYEFEIRLSSTWSSIKFHPVISWYFAGHITTDFPQKVADVSGNRNPPGEGEIIFHLARLYIVTRRSWKFWIPSLYEKHGILKNSCCGVVLLPLLSGCQTLCVMPGKLLGLPEDSQCFDEVLCLKWWEILGYCLFREQKDGDLFQQTLQLTLGMQSPCQMMNGVYSHLLRKVFRFHHHF